MVLNLPDITWSSRFLQPKRNFLKILGSLLWFTASSLFSLKICFGCFGVVMAEFESVPELDYDARLSVQLSTHSQGEATHNISGH